FIDTTIFMFIAFYHVSPKFTVAFIFSLIFPYWILKVVFAILDTPFVYLGVRWVKNSKSDIDVKQ
ncbi:VUT family protein, partial [Patescibacteria group bacterium]|nr:VUT family protein [Patescibacteria group bacterium]